MNLLALVFLFNSLSFANDLVPVDFEETIPTCLSTQEVWRGLEAAMSDSSQSWLWPEKASSIKGEGLFENAKIEVTYYQAFVFSSTFTYELKNIVPEVSFSYEATKENHPFVGGAQLLLEDHGSHRTLKWKGRYLTKPSDWLERRFFSAYAPFFFYQLKSKIKAHEKKLCL